MGFCPKWGPYLTICLCILLFPMGFAVEAILHCRLHHAELQHPIWCRSGLGKFLARFVSYLTRSALRQQLHINYSLLFLGISSISHILVLLFWGKDVWLELLLNHVKLIMEILLQYVYSTHKFWPKPSQGLSPRATHSSICWKLGNWRKREHNHRCQLLSTCLGTAFWQRSSSCRWSIWARTTGKSCQAFPQSRLILPRNNNLLKVPGQYHMVRLFLQISKDSLSQMRSFSISHHPNPEDQFGGLPKNNHWVENLYQ